MPHTCVVMKKGVWFRKKENYRVSLSKHLYIFLFNYFAFYMSPLLSLLLSSTRFTNNAMQFLTCLDLLWFWPGLVHPFLGNLVVPCSWEVTILMPNLVRIPNWHSTLQLRTPGLKLSFCLSFPSSWDYTWIMVNIYGIAAILKYLFPQLNISIYRMWYKSEWECEGGGF